MKKIIIVFAVLCVALASCEKDECRPYISKSSNNMEKEDNDDASYSMKAASYVVNVRNVNLEIPIDVRTYDPSQYISKQLGTNIGIDYDNLIIDSGNNQLLSYIPEEDVIRYNRPNIINQSTSHQLCVQANSKHYYSEVLTISPVYKVYFYPEIIELGNGEIEVRLAADFALEFVDIKRVLTQFVNTIAINQYGDKLKFGDVIMSGKDMNVQKEWAQVSLLKDRILVEGYTIEFSLIPSPAILVH